MYSDQDGAASKQSQAAYEARRRILLSTTSVLSWLGFFAALWSSRYRREEFMLSSLLKPTNLYGWSQLIWATAFLNSLRLHWNDHPVKLYTAALRGSLLYAILVALLLLLAASPDQVGSFTVISSASLQMATASALAVIQVLFPRHPDLFTPEGKSVDLENSRSAFEKYSMQWCYDALHLAGQRPKLDQFPVLDYHTRSRSQPLIAMSSPHRSLWDHILAERYLGFLKQWVLMFVRSLVTLGSPYCVMRLLRALENQLGNRGEAWIWLVGIAAFSTAQTIINHHLIWIQWSEMGIPIRAQLIMALFQKLLKLRDSKDPKLSQSNGAASNPDGLNLISSDTLSFSKFTAVNYIIPSSFVRLFFAGLFLTRLLGWQSSLTAIVVTALSVPIHTIIIKKERSVQKALTAARDRKTKVVTEALHSVRHIKFSALETQWEKRIEAVRKDEFELLRKTSVARNIRSVWSVTAPFLVAAASVSSYVYRKRSLSPSIIFPLVQVLPHLQGTLGFLPVVFQDYFGARSNSKRMEEFLTRPEQKSILRPSPSGCISFKNVSMAWPSENSKNNTDPEELRSSSSRFSLRDINLEFPAGELSVIYGDTGSGKSLLLSSIIGEADLLQGYIEAPSKANGQPVAFVSQTIWLQNATIRDNILFGSPLDKARYNKVLAACALYPDLASLPKGDDTLVGLRGVKLSGGQRARVSFGRALYSSAQTLVLDDMFSALDSHVAREIFDALTGELCRGRTRILVTHQVSLCLPKARYIVHIKNNTVNHAGFTDQTKNINDIKVDEGSIPRPPIVDLTKRKVVETSAKRQPMPKTKKGVHARTDLNVYRDYFTAAGGLRFSMLYLIGLLTKQIFGTLTTWSLGRVNSARSQEPLSATKTPNHLYSYLLVSFSSVLLEFLFNLHSFSGSLRASKTLFQAVTFRVLRAPLLWIDNTPVGEMLKRFTVDARMVDDNVLALVSEFADCIVKMMIIICFGVYTSIYTATMTFALLFWCAKVSQAYIKARTTVKRADSEPTAEILELFTSSSAGVSTIRAFGAVDQFIDQMHSRLDRLSTARRHFWIFNRWLGLQMSLIGILFTTGTGMILLSSTSIIDASLVGFTLTFSLEFSQVLFKAVNNFGILETYMDAAGAVIAYSRLETEKQGGDDIPERWPEKGEIEVRGLNVSYSPDMPLVLKDLSFTVESHKRVGIVGRTGAGKSSLTLSLLRLIEPQGGCISIDGIDISTIKLQALRSNIAFIPQDPVLFSGTVRSNLDYFQQVPERKLRDALRRVKLSGEEEDDVPGFFTLDSPISPGGVNMSQGQRQLLCLARTLITNASIVILDEATSAIDDDTDSWIQETITNGFGGTVVVVAHRLKTIATFDNIIVMDDGKIAEIGSPATLLSNKGLFFELVQNSDECEVLIDTIRKHSR